MTSPLAALQKMLMRAHSAQTLHHLHRLQLRMGQYHKNLSAWGAHMYIKLHTLGTAASFNQYRKKSDVLKSTLQVKYGHVACYKKTNEAYGTKD